MPLKTYQLLEESNHKVVNGLPLANSVRTIDKRLVLLVMAGGIIGGLCTFKLTRHYAPPGALRCALFRYLPPRSNFTIKSAPSKIVRLEAYLGRQRVFVVFFEGQAGAYASPTLGYLRHHWKRLRHANIQVIAISTALPQDNRKDIAKYGDFPFPLLSDPDFHVHRDWGLNRRQNRKAFVWLDSR